MKKKVTRSLVKINYTWEGHILFKDFVLFSNEAKFPELDPSDKDMLCFDFTFRPEGSLEFRRPKVVFMAPRGVPVGGAFCPVDWALLVWSALIFDNNSTIHQKSRGLFNLNTFLLLKEHFFLLKLSKVFLKKWRSLGRRFNSKRFKGELTIDFSRIFRTKSSLNFLVKYLFLLEDESAKVSGEGYIKRILRIDRSAKERMEHILRSRGLLSSDEISLSSRAVVRIYGLDVCLSRDYGLLPLTEALCGAEAPYYVQKQQGRRAVRLSFKCPREEGKENVLPWFLLLFLTQGLGVSMDKGLSAEDFSAAFEKEFGPGLSGVAIDSSSKVYSDDFYEGFRWQSYKRRMLYKKLRKIAVRGGSDPLAGIISYVGR